jgi:O-methyltransferase
MNMNILKINPYLKSLLWIWRLTPEKFRRRLARVRLAFKDEFPLITNPTYADDGLISQHITDFMNDSKFIQSYDLGKATGALIQHPGDIHFRAYIACWAAKYAINLDGNFVECGAGKGLLSRAICNYVDFEQSSKKFFLFDTFEGIPIDEALDHREKVNMEFLNQKHFNSDYSESVHKTFSKYPNVTIVKGRVPFSFESIDLGNISYLSIDMNNATAEIASIEYLWNLLVIGGVVILDDYAYGPEFLGQKKAWDRFALSKGFDILTLPTGQGLIIKNIHDNMADSSSKRKSLERLTKKI